MKSVAKGILVGVPYNPKTSTTSNGDKRIQFALRVWDNKKEDSAFFLNCVAYGSKAEVLEKHISKAVMYVEAAMRGYKDKDGIDRIEFVVLEFSFT